MNAWFEVITLSSVSHIATTSGIDAEFHRMKVALPDGTTALVPTITGNSIRGILRDALMRHLIETLDIQRLPVGAYHLLDSGGALERGTGDKFMRLEVAARLTALMPALSLFGASLGNVIVPGRWSSGMLIPLAHETLHLLPDGLSAELSVYDLMQVNEYSRRDTSAEAIRDGLTEPDPARAPQQMRYRVETLVAGARLLWRVAFHPQITPLERQAFFCALATWGRNPTLGGKSAVGHGLVELRGAGIVITPEIIDVPAFDDYVAHLLEHAEAIREALNAL